MSAAANTLEAYEQEVRVACADLLRLAAEDEAGWKVVSEKSGVRILYKEATENSPLIFKGEGVVDAPIEAVVDLLGDPANKSEYDSLFDKAELIERYSPTIRVEYHLYRKPSFAPFFSARDLCMLLSRGKLEDGTIVLMGKSTTHDKVPERSGFTRAHVHLGGWIIRPAESSPGVVDPTRTRLVFFGSTDLKGSIPSAIKHKAGTRQPEQIFAIRNLLKKRMEKREKMSEEEKEKMKKEQEENIASLPVFTAAELEAAKQAQQAA